MKQVIYTKYANDRADQFKIATSILQDKLGNKNIQKRGTSKQGKQHIEGIYRHYKALSTYFKNENLSFNLCEIKDDYIELEYLEGKTFDEVLDCFIDKEDYMGLVEKVKEYVAIITDVEQVETFRMTPEFIDVFGKVNLHNSLKAFQVSNIDLIFSNIIINHQWNVIDYEWTFDFQVPINYVIYRAIHYYIYSSSKRHEVSNLGLYKLLGITDEELSEYKKMEENFQTYILRGMTPIRELYDTMGEKVYDVENLITNKENDYKYYAQVYYDCGEGFSEANSTLTPIHLDETNKVCLEIEVRKNTKHIRIDPLNVSCMVQVDRMVAIDDHYYSLDYTTNGILMEQGKILFDVDDAQMLLNNIADTVKKIELVYLVDRLSKEFLIEISKVVHRRTEMIKENEEIIEKNEEILEVVNQKQAKIDELEQNVEGLNHTITELHKVNQVKDQNLEALELQLRQQQEETRRLQSELEQKLAYIEEVHSTKVWRLYQKYKSIGFNRRKQ